MLENLSFTDAQGQSFTDAVVRVKSANLSTHTSENIDSNFHIDLTKLDEPVTVNTNNHGHSSKDLTVEYVYWATQTAYVNGLQPYPLAVVVFGNYTPTIHIGKDVLDSEDYAGLELEALCETYFTNEVLPTLTPETA